MRKFFDKLASLASRAWNWLKGTRPAKFIARSYNKAVNFTAGAALWTFYGGRRRRRVFGTKVGRWVAEALWVVASVPAFIGTLVYDLVKPVVVTATKVALTVTAYAWAALTVLWTLEVAFYFYVYNTIGHGVIRSCQWAYHKIAGTPEMPKRISRYIPAREAIAYELSLFVWAHAFVARISRRVIGDKPTWRIVQTITDTVARLHAPTYDFWFGEELPYNTPVDGGESYAVIVRDVTEEEMNQDIISEQEKSANWFISNGFVLIATDAPGKSDKDIFNEYVRERWANLNVAEVATDEYGRTWVVPSTTGPLFKDVSTVTTEPRGYADQEIAWMAIGDSDPVARSYSYGRHWIASLADQDPRILTDEEAQKRERAFMHSKMKGGSMLVEHLLKGFDAWLAEHQDTSVSA